MVHNLTQHDPTPSQVAAGVQPPIPGAAALLTLNSIEEAYASHARAAALVKLLQDAGAEPGARVMVGGAPILMGPLVDKLIEAGFRPLYAFSTREVEETKMPDGSVRKSSVFVHVDFLPARLPA